MKNTADVTGGKPIPVLLQSISDVSAINLSVALYFLETFFFMYYFLVSCGVRDKIKNSTSPFFPWMS
jgi:hypothetical protein